MIVANPAYDNILINDNEILVFCDDINTFPKGSITKFSVNDIIENSDNISNRKNVFIHINKDINITKHLVELIYIKHNNFKFISGVLLVNFIHDKIEQTDYEKILQFNCTHHESAIITSMCEKILNKYKEDLESNTNLYSIL